MRPKPSSAKMPAERVVKNIRRFRRFPGLPLFGDQSRGFVAMEAVVCAPFSVSGSLRCLLCAHHGRLGNVAMRPKAVVRFGKTRLRRC